MNITECVPLAGQGLVARRGHLVALSDGMDAGPDPLLTALAAVANANGDGAALMLGATRAAAERGGRPAWACAGVTAGNEVAVLVHGEAAALVSVDGRPEVQVTASGSMIPVAGTFTGAVVTVRLVLGPPVPPDPRLWLEAGTVFGGGVLLVIRHEPASDLMQHDPHASAAAAMPPAMERAVENMLLHPAASEPSVPAPPGVAPGEVYPADCARRSWSRPAGRPSSWPSARRPRARRPADFPLVTRTLALGGIRCGAAEMASGKSHVRRGVRMTTGSSRGARCWNRPQAGWYLAASAHSRWRSPSAGSRARPLIFGGPTGLSASGKARRL